MIEKITVNVLERIIDEVKKDENQNKIEIEIINPLLIKFSNKIYPYIKIGFIIYIINFIMGVIILSLLLVINKKSILKYNE